MTATSITVFSTNGNKKLNCELYNYQIVNGGQTIRSIYKFLEEDFDDEKLSSAQILIRIFQTEKNDELTNNIAEYTNSQNAISPIDLKSISNIQIELERYLKNEDILYIRKAGDTGTINPGKKRISIELLAQLIFSSMGYPDKASNQKKSLFDKFYSDIFNPEKDFDDVKNIINKFFEIQEEYKNLNIDITNQKCFYTLWLIDKYKKNTKEAISLIENCLKEYRKDEQISNARKLIQSNFKNFIEKEINSSSNLK